MISIALIIVSVGLLIYGKMPLLGGKIIRGVKVRYAGVLILLISVCTFFLPTKLSLILSGLTLAGLGGAYFFLKGEDPTAIETTTMLFSSTHDEKKAYSSATKGLVITVVIMVAFGGGAWLLIKLIKG
jgi:hypothetical protein